MLAKLCCMSAGVGFSKEHLPSFDKALLSAGVGNYNLVRLSSILPAHHTWVPVKDIDKYIEPGSLLPTAYSTISSSTKGDIIVSTIGVGIPIDKSSVGVIMEYSAKNVSEYNALKTLDSMIKEAFEERKWGLKEIKHIAKSAKVTDEGEYTTFACIAEW